MLRTIGLATTLCLLCSCRPLLTSHGPLSQLKDSRPDPELVGTWLAENREEPANFVVVQIDRVDPGSGSAMMQASALVGDGPAVPRPLYRFHVTNTDGARYLNVPVAEDGPPEDDRHYVVKYEVTPDELRVWALPDEDTLREAIRAGELPGTIEDPEPRDAEDESEPTEVEDEPRFELEATGAELRAWLTDDHERLFPPDSGQSYRRLKALPSEPTRIGDWISILVSFLAGGLLTLLGIHFVRGTTGRGNDPSHAPDV